METSTSELGSMKNDCPRSRIEILKEIVRALGLNPEEILTREALAKPHRTVITPEPNWDQKHIDTLLKAVKQNLKGEIIAEIPNVIHKTV